MYSFLADTWWYGAWGYQLDWIGAAKMSAWWEQLVGALEPYDVIYCLTGEPNLLLGRADRLLPDHTMADLVPASIWNSRLRRYHGLKRVLKRFLPYTKPDQALRRRRKAGWGAVLKHLAAISGHPIIVHTNSGALSVDAIENSSLLAAVTTQSGHSRGLRNALWQIPLESSAAWPDKPFINLETWYEGITGDFFAGDQLYAYWSSMLAGAASFCYGAHGIWNVGDGRFLAHWGKQTFDEALMLDTLRLIGLSHSELQKYIGRGEAETRVKNGELISISLTNRHGRISYYPEISRAENIVEGSTWLPLQGCYVERLPQGGQVVQFSNV